jgi:hypothetical protein
MATITGTDKVDSLKILRGDSVTALAGNDIITVTEADSYDVNTLTPFGVIDRGAGTDTLVLKAPNDY